MTDIVWKPLALMILLTGGSVGCATIDAAAPPAAEPLAIAAAADPSSLLATCDYRLEESGLVLTCSGAYAALARMDVAMPVDDAVLTSAEVSLVTSFGRSAGGEVRSSIIRVSDGERYVPVTGFQLFRANHLVLDGVVMAAAIEGGQIFVMSCFTVGPDGFLCPTLIQGALTQAIPLEAVPVVGQREPSPTWTL